MADFTMPSLGADMEQGELMQWLVQPGQKVSKGDLIAVIGTDKGEIEIEVFEDGVVQKLVAEPGQILPVGAVLAVLAPSAEAQQPARLKASPLARRVAQALGVDLHQVKGTGMGGGITKDDVEKAAAQQQDPVRRQQPREQVPEPKPPALEPLPRTAAAPSDKDRMRRAIATAMAMSNREIPHYYLATSIDMSSALGWLQYLNSKRPMAERILPAALELAAVARALTEVPELNGEWVDGEHRIADQVHLAFIVSLRRGGLAAPVMRSAQTKSLTQTMEAMTELILKARGGRLSGLESSGASCTVTNLGDQGVESVYGVIYPPQVCLVGLGKIAQRPWAVDGMLGVRPILSATVAGDHRATDGLKGAKFLNSLEKILNNPEKHFKE